jgi:aspartyl-tRNA(Asn)/glutamyl-tRNA(Gln) amidotransferase subunit C
MTTVNVELVDHVAALARLSLSDEERAVFARQLAEILAYAASIQSLETSDVPAMSHAQLSGTFREDTPGPGLDRDTVLASAPDPDSGLFRVPRILGG